MDSETLVSLKDVWKTYEMGEVDVHALRGVDLEIRKGDFVAIIGSSGSGKSTMMNLVGCLDTPTKGTIRLKGKDINKLSESQLATLRGKTIGFIFQQYNLIPTLSAYENILLPLDLQEYPENQAKKTVLHTLELVGLLDKQKNLPTQLSGGQQQRVSIARCLVANPEVILADEPTGALDSKTGKEILDLLVRLWKDEEKTVIMVTHDLKLASLANTKIELKDGQIVSVKTNLRDDRK